jgi:hypothetical protein
MKDIATALSQDTMRKLRRNDDVQVETFSRDKDQRSCE